MMEVKIAEIVVENRIRKAKGLLDLSIDALERSIEHLGVLQPIGITKDKRLIFGERRLLACKRLKMETIPARIFDINADDPIMALRMERDENEHRKDLTPSEKIAIADKIEEALAGRNHRPHKSTPNLADLLPDAITSEGETFPPRKKVDPQNFACPQGQPETKKEECQNFVNPPRGESREIAAAAVGMKRETYRQAKAVVKSGDQTAIQAMDTGEKSINAAYNIIKKTVTPQTFKITLKNNPDADAEILLEKGGQEYCTKLALAMLKAAGHNVELGVIA